MAARRTPTVAASLPDAAERLAIAQAPWLTAARARLVAARLANRFPHALLVVGRAGLGQSELGLWTAQLTLCEGAAARPCGVCPSCVLFHAGNHPDFHPVSVEDDATVIKVDQVRELSAVLAMRSYRGGQQVGMIDPADALNVNAFNALLKTLEEPSEKTLLILVASRPVALPATIVSRCMRLAIAPPSPGSARTWLEGVAKRPDWPEVLGLADGAPLAALALAGSGAADLGPELARELAALGSPAFDPWKLAEAWHKDRPAERLRWLEHWTSGWLRVALAAGDGVNNNRGYGLPRPRPGMNMAEVFSFLDRLRAARAALEGPLNVQLLLEDLLVGLGEAFAAADGRTG